MAKPDYFLLVDTETTQDDLVADFGAIVVNKKGKIVWEVSNDDIEENPFKDPCGGQRLANGNTVIASYGAQEGIKLFEVNRKKEMVWSYDGYKVHHFQILTTNGKPLKGKPMK